MINPPVIETTPIKGWIFDIRKYSVQDGPGIRTTVFFKGCPLRCVWCHNPEGMDPAAELMYRKERCTGCGNCISACDCEAVVLTDNSPVTDKELCISCGRCIDGCFSGAREIAGKEMSLDQLMREIESDVVFYDESEGGVTLSGGEPLLQADFARALLKECRRNGIHTCFDTSGYAVWEVLENVCEYTDLILYDLKIMSDEKHREYTGVSNEPVLSNLQNLSRLGQEIIIRVPLISGINDDNDNVYRLGTFIASLPDITQIELLPYHGLGIHKYERLFKQTPSNDFRSPSETRISEIRSLFTNFGLTVISRDQQL